MKTLAFFNNKAGVGKTSLVYHLAWMYAELGVNVVAIDLDPQSNLTASFFNDDTLATLWEPSGSPRTILDAVQPLLDHLGDLVIPEVQDIDPRIGLIAGDLGLSRFEDRLAETWGKCLDDNRSVAEDAFRVTTAFYRLMDAVARARQAELVLIDVGPNLGAINRAALVAADFVMIPLAADLFSLQGLRNLGPTLRAWRSGWKSRGDKAAESASTSGSPIGLALPSGAMKPIGYVVMSPSIRENYPVMSFRRWVDRIPEVYRQEILKGPTDSPIAKPDPHALATLKNFRSLAPMAQEARKPMFALKPADGAIGGHSVAVSECFSAFQRLAILAAKKCQVKPKAPRRAWTVLVREELV